MDDVTPERWLPVVGWEGRYEVSDLGRVRSLPRVMADGRRVAGRMRRFGQQGIGHPTVHFKRDGVGTSSLVKTLVAAAFLGPCPEHHVVRLRDGDPKNCALANLYYDPHARLFVELGQRIGYGVVIEPEIWVEVPGRTGPTRAARLLCDCGDEYVQLISGLVGARVRRLSCGCMTNKLRAESADRARAAQRAAGRKPRNFKDRTGERHGALVVVRLVEKGKSAGHACWLCRCDCGNEIVALRKSILREDANCGCQRKDPRNKLPSGMAGRNSTLSGYRASARVRGLSWELSGDDFDQITSQDCHYCGVPPSNVTRGKNRSGDFTYNGIDRVDNDRGYTPDNVVPCCRLCNYAKRDLPYGEFMAWLGRLTAHQWFNPQQLPTQLLRGAAA